jgi:hypothetical protein
MRHIIEQICRELIMVNLLAKVIKVDKENYTCDVKPVNGAAELLDVRLRADDGKNDGQIIFPKMGSLVLIAPIDNDRATYFVAMFSEVEEVCCIIENTRLITGKNGVTIARDKDGLKEALTDLTNEILKIYAPMNKPAIVKIQTRIKNILNDA